MKQRTLAIITITLGSLLVVSLGFLVLFGVRLSAASKEKSAAVTTRLAEQEKQLKTTFQLEKEKTLANYTAADVFGSFSFSYPKIWSTSVVQDIGASEELVFLGDPNMIVFDKQAIGPITALRVQVFSESYETKVEEIRSKYISKEDNPYTEKDVTVSSIGGKKYAGINEETGKKYSFILLPLRDKTLYIGTDDSDTYSQNLDTIVKSFKISK